MACRTWSRANAAPPAPAARRQPRIAGLRIAGGGFLGVGLLGGLIASTTPLAAANSYPMVMSVKPVAVQIGKTSDCTIQSRGSLAGSYRVLVSGTGVTAEIADPGATPEKPPAKPDAKAARRSANLQSMKVRFHAEPDAALGIRDVRVAGSYGASTVGQVVVVRDAVIVEAGDNDTAPKAQAVTLPAAVCGTIESAEDRDCFKFKVKAGGSLVFRVHGMQLENRIHDLQLHLDPIITLRSPTGTTLAVCDNVVAGDPLLCHRFQQSGEYTLEIRDVRFKGDKEWVYCVEINDRPFISEVFPIAVAPGERVSFKPVGYQLAKLKTIEWVVPATLAGGFYDERLPAGNDLSNPVPFVVTDLPLVVETAGEHAAIGDAQPIVPPVGVNGRIETNAAADAYSFSAKKGEAFTFEAVARRRGSALDPVLQIVNAEGKPLTEGDDLSEHGRTCADAAINGWTAPADGAYAVVIRDLLQRGGDEFGYFLKVTRARPAFELSLDTDKTELTPGTSGVIFVNSVRKNGFVGEITLFVDGLPDGVTALCDRIPPNHRDGCIILKAAPDAKQAVGNIVVTGKAQHPLPGGKSLDLHTVGKPLQEIYLPGGGRGHWPVESHAVAVGAPGDLRGIQLSSYAVTLKPGESTRIDVTIARAPGFTDNVTLDPRFEHLGRVYGDTLPKGVEVDAKNSKTLLTGNETKGFITLRPSQNVEPMEKRPVAVMANVSLNFVMKSTFSSEPLFVTTQTKTKQKAK